MRQPVAAWATPGSAARSDHAYEDLSSRDSTVGVGALPLTFLLRARAQILWSSARLVRVAQKDAGHIGLQISESFARRRLLAGRDGALSSAGPAALAALAILGRRLPARVAAITQAAPQNTVMGAQPGEGCAPTGPSDVLDKLLTEGRMIGDGVDWRLRAVPKAR